MKNIDKNVYPLEKIYTKNIYISDTDMLSLTENNGYQYLLDIHAEGRVSTNFDWKIISWEAESSNFRPLRGVCACDSAYLYFFIRITFCISIKNIYK